MSERNSLKAKILHTAASIFLIATILFGQVGVNYFHDRHDAHENIAKTDQTTLQKHGEHCKVCSLDLLLKLHLASATLICCESAKALLEIHPQGANPVVFNSLPQDRAPPAC